MKLKIIIAIVIGLAVGLAGLVLVLKKPAAKAPVSLVLQISVDPASQADFVIQQAGSAKFKYLVGKQSGVKPVFAQRLSIKPVPNTALIEARVGMDTDDQARRYLDIFMQTLKAQCGNQAKLAVVKLEKTIR